MTEPEETREARDPASLTRIAQLAYLGMIVWLMIPDHHRQLLRMRIIAAARAAAAGLARRAGVASMRAELDTGRQLYTLPYLLSRARVRLDRAYNHARGTG
jgi:hypothetical protein